MPIDPRIALGYQPPQVESPANMMLRMQQMQAGRQENALRQAQMENYQAEAARRNALLPAELEKAAREANAARLTEQEKMFAIAKQRLGAFRQVTGALAVKPNVTKDDAIAAARGLVTIGMLDQDRADAMLGQLPDDPIALQAALKQSAVQELTPEQMFTLFAPKPTQINAGGRTTVADLNPNSPTYKQTVVDVQHTATPGEMLTDARLREKGAGAATPLLSQAILDGRVPVSRVNSRTAPLFEAALQVDPQADLTALNVGQLGAAAGARTAGTTTANIEIASDEANRMIGVLRDIIPTVNLTNYPSINAVQNAVSRGTGGVEVVKLNTAINSLINSYARAINPRGQPTVSDKNHAREVINNAMSKGQLAGTLEVMEAEMRAALEAATAAGARRGKAGGEGASSGEPAATKPSAKKTKSGVAYTVEED